MTHDYDGCAGGIGRLCAVTTADAKVRYAYDGFGDLTLHQGIGYDHDSAGRLIRVTYPSGAVLDYRYDAAGRIDRVTLTVDGQTQVLADGITHAPFGAITGLTYGNGLTLSQAFDTAGRYSAQTMPGVLARTYSQYDGNGNLKALIPGHGMLIRTTVYTPHHIAVDVTFVPGSGKKKESFEPVTA